MDEDRSDLKDAVKTGNLRITLTAMRDYIAHQLEANLCNACLNSRLRTGDQASLLLRLEKVLEQLEALPSEEGAVSPLDEVRRKRDQRKGYSDPSDPALTRELGTKSAERRSGSRRTGGSGGSAP